MSWVSRMIEDRLANAAAAGELDTPTLHGQPLDLDDQRPEGWWADQFARRELSHDRRQVAEHDAARARAGFWRAETIEVLRERVGDANRAIARVNINLVVGDRLEPFDLPDIERRWHRLRHR